MTTPHMGEDEVSDDAKAMSTDPYRAELTRALAFAKASVTQLGKARAEYDAMQQPAPSRPSGIWTSVDELAGLPMEGEAWDALLSAANEDVGIVDLSDQESRANVVTLAKALYFARSEEYQMRADVADGIEYIVANPTYSGRALALGRNLGAFVIAADLIDLAWYDPPLDRAFRDTLRLLRTAPCTGAASSLIDCHERRPNNWGAHAGFTRAAIAVYLGDTEDLERTATVFHGYLGNRSAYDGFTHGGPVGERDLSWCHDESAPVGINPTGATKQGLSIDGVLPDDQRRGGSFTTSPPKENYVWEALQGLTAQAWILHRAGYPAFEWEDRALLRAFRWLHDVNAYPAEGDDTWQPHMINHVYGTSFPAPVPSRPGKGVGFTDWTHGGGA